MALVNLIKGFPFVFFFDVVLNREQVERLAHGMVKLVMKNSPLIVRKLFTFSMALLLGVITVSCGGNVTATADNARNPVVAQAPAALPEGRYPVQQASYNDANGEYTLFLLNTGSGVPPVYRTTELPMARLTDAEISAGEKSYLQVQGGEQALHLTEDFKIEYVHAVTETQPNPQTGQPQTVVVRQESSFWTPFAGALAGQMVGNLLFTPHYYFPPVYQPGTVMQGYGGYGRTYSQAVNRYQERYQTPPPAVRNNFRTTGQIRNAPKNRVTAPQSGSRPTGSGFGGSTLKRSNQPSQAKPRNTGFGSSRPQSRPGFGSRRSFGGGRRR